MGSGSSLPVDELNLTCSPGSTDVPSPHSFQVSVNFQVTLAESPADKKIGVIKVLRELTGLGLKEAKDLVDAAPKAVKEGVKRADAEEMVKKIKEAGGEAELQ